MRKLLPAVAAVALGCSGAAHADWIEASSPHFVVYAEESEGQVLRIAQELEMYHRGMAVLTRFDLPDPSPSNRLTVFVVRNVLQVQKLFGGGNPFLGGFYFPRAGDSIAVVPNVTDTREMGGEQDFSMVTLLHEYAHHFLISSNSSIPTPRWLGEGAAEFFSSAGFPVSGGLEIGMPAYHRADELLYARNVRVQQLLDPDYDSSGAHGYDAFYGKSWLLFHYLTLSGQRRGQLGKYEELLIKGEGSLQAGRDAFGDLKQLDRELDKYQNQGKMVSLTFQANQVAIGAVTVRRLSDAEQEIMPDVIRTRVGETPEMAKTVIADVQQVAAKYPNDARVLIELAEAQCDAGNNDAAVAAADKAIALDPKLTRAYFQKGRALFAEAEKAKNDKDAAYKKAVAPWLALNRLEPDDPLPLVYYYRSFTRRGAAPTPAAVDGLVRAGELAPFDLDLRLDLAEYQINAKDYVAARSNLVPIAFTPHASPMSAGARALIERIDGGKPPSSQEAAKIIESSQKAAKDKGAKGGEA